MARIYTDTETAERPQPYAETFPALFTRMPKLGGLLGILGILMLVLSFVMPGLGGPKQFFQAYLYGWIFWMSVTMGCFGFMVLHNLVRGSWGVPVIRLFEAGAKSIPLMGLLFLPVFFGISYLYPWMDAARVATDPVLLHKTMWENPTFFFVRNVFYYLVWITITQVLTSMAARQDRTGNGGLAQTRINFAAPAFVLYIITLTFAITDWVVSLDAHWYSTISGFYFVATSGLAALAFINMLTCYMKFTGNKPHAEIVTPQVTRDLGNLTLTLTLIWAYFSLSQYLITWSGNLPDEITFYVQRNTGLLKQMSAFLMVGQFFLPFLMLLSGKSKRFPRLLFNISLWIFFVRIIDVFWNVVPAYSGLSEGLRFHWTYIAGFIGIGGIWIAAFFTLLKRNALVPVPDAPVTEGH